MPTRTAWVLGSSGFLGGAVGRRYVDLGWHVWGAGRPNHSIPEGYAGWMTGAVTEALLTEMAESSPLPDLVFHGAGGARVGAAETDPLGDFEKSVESTRTVVEFLVRHKPDAAFVFPSSAAVYGACDAGPITETTRCAPVSHYGRHKVLCEGICEIAARDHGLRSLVIRFFSVYGPGLRKQLLWDLGRQLLDGKRQIELGGTGAETRDFLQIDDAVALITTACDKGWDGVATVNGGTGEASRIDEIAAALCHEMASQAQIIFTGVQRPGDPIHYCADISRATALGWSPRLLLADGVRRYANWLQQDWKV